MTTPAGPVQFGAPPETIKDSLSLGLDVPSTFVLPSELFNRDQGVNVAEVEFPAYYNFFILGRRLRLVVADRSVEARIRSVFSETLFGPDPSPIEGEFAADFPIGRRPDFRAEGQFFRKSKDGKPYQLDDLLEFVILGAAQTAGLGHGVEVRSLADQSFAVLIDGEEIARAPARTILPEREPPGTDDGAPFMPPDFGITVLGSSHGFDPSGKTTGFILWVGKRGLLVDPPADTTAYLRRHNVPSKMIEGIIVTHCHADHDGGAFCKLLEEGLLDVYTTPRILGSFLRKYAALSNIPESMLRSTFRFRPVQIGAPCLFHGGELRFFYTLHSIPTIGFEAFYAGESLAFSSDSLYDPEAIRELEARGVLHPWRANALIDFPWHHSVVLHEAGVPPLHTPAKVLAELPERARKNLYVVHIAAKDVPESLQSAPVGLENTIRLPVTAPRYSDATAILDAFCSVDLFRDFPITRAREVLHLAERISFEPGDVICAQGEPGDAFFIIEHGTVAVSRKGIELKLYGTGHYFGESSLVLDQPRNADVIARTPVTLIRLAKHGFLYLLRGTDVPRRMVHLARVRSQDSWQLFEHNSVIRTLTAGQKTTLQTILEPVTWASGHTLWTDQEPAKCAVIVHEGALVMCHSGAEKRLGPGALVGDIDALIAGERPRVAVKVSESGRGYRIARDQLVRFLHDNPGAMISFLGTSFVE